MTTQSKITPKRYLSLAMAVGSALCFSNASLAQASNSGQVQAVGQETLHLAETSSNNLPAQNLPCLPANEFSLSPELLVAQTIIDSRPSYDSRCGDYYTTYKNGKWYECIKCEYNREPYCWERNDLN